MTGSAEAQLLSPGVPVRSLASSAQTRVAARPRAREAQHHDLGCVCVWRVISEGVHRREVSVGVGVHGPATPLEALLSGHPIRQLTKRRQRTFVPKKFPARRRTWPAGMGREAPVCEWCAASKDTDAQANRWYKADRTCHIPPEPALRSGCSGYSAGRGTDGARSANTSCHSKTPAAGRL
jgi:hypothetical protein